MASAGIENIEIITYFSSYNVYKKLVSTVIELKNQVMNRIGMSMETSFFMS